MNAVRGILRVSTTKTCSQSFTTTTSLLRQNHHVRFLTTSSSDSLVDWHVDSASKVGTITLQSPQSFNALTMELGAAFHSTITQIRHDLTTGRQNVNAIVLQGAGDKAFSAGGNVAWLQSLRHNSIPENEALMLQFYRSFLSIRQLPVPVVAALQGPAIGAGCCLAMACDLRVAVADTKLLGFTFSKLGIHSGLGGTHLLQRLVGSSSKANEWLLTGKVLTGREAHQWGLVNRLVDDVRDVKPAAVELAHEVARQNPMAIRTMIATLRYQQDQGLEESILMEAKAQAICYSRNDWGEGVQAAIEKRDPEFDDYHTTPATTATNK
ncbi:hydroxybutyryl-CoA dehydratase-like protein, mitochondrial [Seminavis robusta]|uniref:Hydroxybutyryl-CoA dehydratase-like protein, mitochondrial n=1 Tax=Seminavis robusta TaxID=568900 RepID=A0A9N8EJY8_9STRA|nr:hydroxybutyryl-CoA dehydratase-like protein, mitochondrial [Seminavis robusta]|eukprot:Sro1270_g257930.1 hydroxybutyryl-CoA dehydratase-like protein, mitochondrial (324) ;mRNA; f:8312-9283